MFQHICAVYQRIMRLPGASACRSVSLNVDALEDRCTPAISAGLLPLLHPPEPSLIVQASFVPVLPHAEPTLAANAQAAVATSLLRADLFGGAGDEQTEEGNDAFGPIHESAFDWNDRSQPNPTRTEPAARISEAKSETDDTRDHRRDNHEAGRLAPCVVLEFDAELDGE